MPKNVAIDNKLIPAAQKPGRHRTATEAVTAALEEYVTRRRQLEILSMIGTIDYHKEYDYKRERRRRASRRAPPELE
jgi:hypothetical protein